VGSVRRIPNKELLANVNYRRAPPLFRLQEPVLDKGELLSEFADLAMSINLTKSVYLVNGQLKGYGWAHFLYQATGPPQGEAGCVFAAGVANDFKFKNLLAGPSTECWR
jgi:hypothetical protein